MVVMLTVLLVALGAAGGAAYLVLRGEPVKNVTLAYTTPKEGFSDQWLNGHQKTWDLEADDAAQEAENTWVDSVGDWVIREYITPPGGAQEWVRKRREDPEVAEPPGSQYTTSVEVYSTKTGQPELKWRSTFPGEAADVGVWQSQLLVGNQLIDLETQKVKTAPWSLDSTSFVTGQGILACETNRCALWKDLDTRLWEQAMPLEGKVWLNKYNQVGDYVVIWNGQLDTGRTAVLDLASGSAKVAEDVEWQDRNPKVKPHPWPHMLADGWYTLQHWTVWEGQEEVVNYHVAFYGLEGNLVEAFDVPQDKSFRVYPWSPTPLTREQAGKWLRDGDTSWAPGTVSISLTDASCQSVIVGGHEIDLGGKNSLVQKDKNSGECKNGGRVSALRLAGGGPVLVLGFHAEYAHGLIMVDVRNGRTADKIETGKYVRYTIHNQTMLIVDAKGKVTAFRPA